MCLRDESKEPYSKIGEIITHNEIKIGCLQRIADATEAMARRYQELIDERDRYKRWYEQEQAAARRFGNQVRGLKSAITRMKKRKLTRR